MKTYKINWYRNDCGKIYIKAKSEQEAREKFETGYYNESDLEIKEGSIDIYSIETV